MPADKFPHDAAYKRFFSNPEMVKSLLQEFVPEDFIKDFDFNTLEPCDSSYTTRHFQKRYGDTVWRLRWKDTYCYICILIEYQSSHDEWMALRILNYTGLFWENLVKKKRIKAGSKLPPVFPIVLYNGEKQWTASLNISELIESLHEKLSDYQPKQKYFLVDEKHVPAEILDNAKGASAYLLPVEQAKSSEDICDIAVDFNARFSGDKNENIRADVINWMERKIYKIDPDWLSNIKEKHGMEGSTMLLELLDSQKDVLDKYRQQYIDEGKAEGISEGIAKGIATQKSTLLEMLADRFGEIPASWKVAISQITDPDILSKLTRAILKIKSQDEYGEILNGVMKAE